MADVMCEDCDAPAILGFGEAGNGKCSSCHGTGEGGMIEGLMDALAGDDGSCDTCDGSGVCQSCGGTGVVDDGTTVIDGVFDF